MSPAVALPEGSRPRPATAAQPLVIRRTRSRDIDEHTGQLQNWNLHCDQLDAGRFDGEFTDIRLPGM